MMVFLWFFSGFVFGLLLIKLIRRRNAVGDRGVYVRDLPALLIPTICGPIMLLVILVELMFQFRENEIATKIGSWRIW